jgi:hypothetical protein
MAGNLISRFSGSTGSDCRWRYKRSTVLETAGIAALSRLIYMLGMMKMSLVPFGHDCLARLRLHDGSRHCNTQGRVKVVEGSLKLSFRPTYHEKRASQYARKEQYSSDELGARCLRPPHGMLCN